MTVLGATFVFHRYGFHSLPYRVANFVESVTLLTGFVILMGLSGFEAILWAFYLIMTVAFAQSTGANWVGLTAVVLPPVTLGLVARLWPTPGQVEGPVLIGATILAAALYWYFGTIRRRQVDLLEKVLESEKELAAANEQLRVEKEMRELERRHHELEERMVVADKMASLGVLAAGVAHEINNPLTYISGNIEYLAEKEEIPAPLRQPLRDVQAGLLQIERIVRDLKTFSYSSGQGEYELLDLRTVCERVERMVKPEVRRIARFSVELPVEPVIVPCRSDQIHQILLNLIINATQALPENREENQVVLRLTDDGENALVSVEDNGMGIAEADLRRVFDPFFTTKGPGSGTGLGLSVSYRIAAQHGGQIFVRSKEGAGATFTLSLPRTRPWSGERHPILIVDDEERTLALFRNILSEFAVTTVKSVREGRAYFEQPFRAVLCDIRLADGNGVELYNEAPEALRERFLFLTALPSDAEELRGLPPGTQILQKPVPLEELRQHLRRMVAREEMHGAIPIQ
jgi:signal transduction histidine kinase/CheY-like chemotaxis protein